MYEIGITFQVCTIASFNIYLSALKAWAFQTLYLDLYKKDSSDLSVGMNTKNAQRF